MYRRRRMSLPNVIFLIVGLTFVAVSGYFYYNAKRLHPDIVAHTPTPEPTPTPTPEPTPPPGIPAKGIIGSGQNLFTALLEAGVPNDQANMAVSSLKEIEFPFRHIRPGQVFTIYLTEGGKLTALDFQIDRLIHYEMRRDAAENMIARKVEIPTTIEIRTMGAHVTSCVYNAIIENGENMNLASLVSNLFAWDIDFYTDPRKGDSFKLIYERRILPDGEVYGYGRLLAGEYDGKITGRKHGFWVDVGDEEYTGFYDENGFQMKRTFLRAPLDTMRVTSRYGMRRHPILGRRMMHHGVDYGAPTGTPVWAVADGTVIFAGRSGAAGNMVKIRHEGGLVSMYLHLSRITVRRGQHVGQKQLIGRVGSTGRSTGPHLDFRVTKNGSFVNPQKLKMYSHPAKKLTQEHWPVFEKIMEQFHPQLDRIELPPMPEPPAEEDSAEPATESDEPCPTP